MNKVNLLTLYNVNQISNIDLDAIKKFFNLKDIKRQELEGVISLCKIFIDKKPSFSIYENYYINYKLPHIEKEFDILKLGNDKIINIELKSQVIDENKILSQLNRNHYYLSSLKKQETLCFTFISEDKKFFYYDSDKETIIPIDIDCVITKLESIVDSNDTLDDLFTPKDFLISPFNNTQDFLDNKYFLTNQQEEIRSKIISSINQNKDKIFSISGVAGTGKTLLTYDLAKNLMNYGKQVCIIHCAKSNAGIERLKQEKWDIKTIKEFSSTQESEIQSDVLIFDESQRIGLKQLGKILQMDKIVIFSHDVKQRLNRENNAEKVVNTIIASVDKENNYTLSTKIRHNKKLASFIYKFLGIKKIKEDDFKNEDYSDVIIHYEKNIETAKLYMSYLNEHWKHIHLTTSQYNQESIRNIKFFSIISAHEAIGQEYDNVAITISKNFCYADGKLQYEGRCYYPPIETLFQAITRVRRKLLIVIIDNEEVYLQCMKIIHRDTNEK